MHCLGLPDMIEMGRTVCLGVQAEQGQGNWKLVQIDGNDSSQNFGGP